MVEYVIIKSATAMISWTIEKYAWRKVIVDYRYEEGKRVEECTLLLTEEELVAWIRDLADALEYESRYDGGIKIALSTDEELRDALLDALSRIP